MYPNVVITGSPGVGKTFISRRLAKLYGLKYVSINDLILEYGLYTGIDEERESYIIDIERTREFIIESFDWDGLVVEGHVVHLVVPSEYIDLCIVLRLDPYTLFDRLLDKGFAYEKALENVQAEILDIVYREALKAYGPSKILHVDVSSGYEKVFRAIDHFIGRNGLPESDYVDWLGLVTKNGDLKLFFP